MSRPWKRGKHPSIVSGHGTGGCVRALALCVSLQKNEKRYFEAQDELGEGRWDGGRGGGAGKK